MEVIIIPSPASERLDAVARYVDVLDLQVEVESVLHHLSLGHSLEAHLGCAWLDGPKVDELGWISEPIVDIDG